MKKIFVFLLLMVVSFALKAQYPIQQNLGSDSTIIYIKGAARTVGGFINGTYTDTSAANLTRIRQYQAAQIFTTSDSAMWFRMPGATKWVRFMPATPPSPNVDTSYWSLSGNYVADRVATPKLGTTTGHELNIITNDTIRLTIPVYGIRRVTGNENRYLVIDTTIGSNMYVGYMDGGSGSTSLYWSIGGNTRPVSIADTSFYFGTNDTSGIYFRTNGRIAGYLVNNEPLSPLYTAGTTPHPNVAYGSHAGENAFINQEKTSNTFIGSYAGRFTRSGANVFIGDHAALMHTFGGPFGGRNVAIGHWAMNWGYRAYDNTGVGTFVFNQLWDGVSNAGFGRDVFKSATHGNGNSGFGAYAGLFNSTGIIGATITNPGSGYTTATVVISPPNFDQNYGECGEQATGTAIISGGQIIGITITNPGCGYVKFVSDSINQLGYNTTFYGPTITITGDGSGATATPVFSYAENNTYAGSFSGLYRRYSQYETAIGHLAAGGSRWKDTSNTFLGHLSDVDASVPVTTSVNYSTAVGYNAKVGASNVIVLGATGSNQPNVGIGTISPTKLLDVRGDILVNDLTIGRGGGNSNTNVVFGNDLPTSVDGTYNVIIGRSALKGGGGNTTGSNTAVGGQSLYSLSTSGYGNVAVGTNAFYLHNNAATNLGFNTGVGYLAGFNTTSGEFNSFFGQAAGSNNSSGSHNTAIGYKSAGSVLPLDTSYAHNYNTSVGSLSSYSIRTGSYNTNIGYAAGYSITTGSYNVIIGGNNGSSIATANRRVIISDGEGNTKLYADSVGNIGIGITAPTARLHVVGESGDFTPAIIDGHEDVTGELLNVQQSGSKKFAFHSNGSLEMAEVSLPSTPAAGYVRLTANTDNSKLYTTNDAGKSAQLIQDLQLVFGAGSGADSDTTAFTTSAIYGSFYNDADTIVVTSFRAVLQGTSPDVTYKIWYNDSLNVEAGATALNTSGNQVTSTTTGTNVTSITNTKIPPGVWVWVKTSTVATKPKYFSLTVNGYRK